MNKSELKYNVQATGSYFFDRSSMRFFGDTMRNYYVSANTVTIETPTGNKNVDDLLNTLDKVHQTGIDADIAENGIKAIIHRELANHECQITMDYLDALSALDGYGISEQQVKDEWKEFFQHCIDNDYF